MLREVAALVHKQLREYDFLARYAGDEFVAIVPDLAGPQVDELRERIEKMVSEFSIDIRSQGKARVGISVGASIYGVDGETLDQLLVAADQAMYRAKSTHKTGALRTANLKAGSAKAPSESPAETGLITTAIN
jgi:diguanylate cyclase (GGDEF)-like protein